MLCNASFNDIFKKNTDWIRSNVSQLLTTAQTLSTRSWLDISEAYDVLSDGTKRMIYDELGAEHMDQALVLMREKKPASAEQMRHFAGAIGQVRGLCTHSSPAADGGGGSAEEMVCWMDAEGEVHRSALWKWQQLTPTLASLSGVRSGTIWWTSCVKIYRIFLQKQHVCVKTG